MATLEETKAGRLEEHVPNEEVSPLVASRYALGAADRAGLIPARFSLAKMFREHWAISRQSAQIHRASDLLRSCSPGRQLLAKASMAASRVAS